MSTSVLVCDAPRAAWVQRAVDYIDLAKPRISALVLATVAAAAWIGNGGAPSGWLLLNTLLGTALVAAGAGALNQWWECDRDARMARTANRPLPCARLSSGEVLWFGLLSAALGCMYLAVAVNPLTAALGCLTWLIYVGAYTPLKARTSANTAVGAVAGALPVLMGWAAVGSTAVGRSGGWMALVLFAVVLLWQFPHFMAIAWIYRTQYAAAGLKMLSVVDPSGRRAGVHAALAAAALLAVSLSPLAFGMTGIVYAVGALVLGLAYVFASVAFFRQRTEVTARSLLRVSLVYLPALLFLLLCNS